MAQDFDVIIVGGGSNRLIIGSYLAKAGQKCLLFSARWKAEPKHPGKF
jgi:ribulose 1,5-bisphosphate synthetase/thiazole synthase